MDLEVFTVTKVSQTEKYKYYRLSLMCGIQKENINELIYKERGSQAENKLMVTEGQ